LTEPNVVERSEAGDVLAKDHITPKAHGGKEAYDHGPLLHRHGHDAKTAEERRRYV
jgi:RNA-directed DNA polymerase